jgi:hypothetical protein
MGKKSDARLLAEAKQMYAALLKMGASLPEGIDPNELALHIAKAEASTAAVENAELKLAEATAKEQETLAQAVELLMSMVAEAQMGPGQVSGYEYIDAAAEAKKREIPSA